MPIQLLHSYFDFHATKQEVNPLGYTVFYIFDESINAHSELKTYFERISRHMEHSKFYYISSEYFQTNEEEEDVNAAVEEYQIETFPVFLVFQFGKLKHKFETESSFVFCLFFVNLKCKLLLYTIEEGLVKQFQRLKLIPASLELDTL